MFLLIIRVFDVSYLFYIDWIVVRVHVHLCYGKQIQEDDLGRPCRMRNKNCTLVTRTEWQEALETEVGGKNDIKRDLEGILCEDVDFFFYSYVTCLQGFWWL
jgi:hypothetical protein